MCYATYSTCISACSGFDILKEARGIYSKGLWRSCELYEFKNDSISRENVLRDMHDKYFRRFLEEINKAIALQVLLQLFCNKHVFLCLHFLTNLSEKYCNA